MLKFKNGAMLVVAALCGYLALMTPDWKSDLVANVGPAYEGDLNKDEIGDIVFRNETTKEMRSWTGDGSGTGNYVLSPVAGLSFWPQYHLTNNNWQVVALGDVDGDGDMDIIFRNVASGYNRSWVMEKRPNGIEVKRDTLTFFPQYGSFETSIVGMGDCNGDGTEDLYYYNSDTGVFRIWIMDFTGNRSGLGFFAPQSNMDMEVQTVGDFDNDGDADIFWRDTVTGNNEIWDIDSANCQLQGSARAVTAEPDLAYNVVQAADMNGDGAEDLIWVRSGVQTKFWEMSGGVRVAERGWFSVPSGAVYAGTMDVDSDGTVNQDMLYYNNSTGRTTVMRTDGNWNRISNTNSWAFGAGGAWEVINDRNY